MLQILTAAPDPFHPHGIIFSQNMGTIGGITGGQISVFIVEKAVDVQVAAAGFLCNRFNGLV